MRSLLLCTLLLASFPVHSFAKTAAELISDSRILGRDPSATGRARFTDAQILGFLNEGQRDTLGATLCIRKSFTFDTSSGTIYYDLPGDFMQIDRVTSDDQRLEEKSPAKLDLTNTEWETVTGDPLNFFINFASRTKIGIYPYPVTNTSTETVKVEYYAQAYDMGTSSTPFNGITEFTPFHQMLIFYASAEMGYIDGLLGQADRYFQRYAIYRQQLNDFCRARPGYFPNANVAPSK